MRAAWREFVAIGLSCAVSLAGALALRDAIVAGVWVTLVGCLGAMVWLGSRDRSAPSAVRSPPTPEGVNAVARSWRVQAVFAVAQMFVMAIVALLDDVTIARSILCGAVVGASTIGAVGAWNLLRRWVCDSAGAVVVNVLVLLWLTWPVWPVGIVERLPVQALASLHGPLVINAIIDRSDPLTHRPGLYERSALGQHVPFALPGSALWMIGVGAVIGAAGWVTTRQSHDRSAR